MGMCKPSGGKIDMIGKVGSMPPIGLPNTRVDLYDEFGNLIQQRWYDPDGLAIWDRDWKHKDNPKKPHKFPHDHPFDWSIVKKPRFDYDENRPLNSDYC